MLPLFARLGLGDQQRVFNPGNKRRLILATNVAETSLTIPRIACVIDSGVARVSRWSPGKGVQRLQIEPVSQASARQRKGRCGRVRDGVCVRLYEETELDRTPGIHRSGNPPQFAGRGDPADESARPAGDRRVSVSRSAVAQSRLRRLPHAARGGRAGSAKSTSPTTAARWRACRWIRGSGAC